MRRLQLSDRERGGAHRRACGQAAVDEDDRLARHVGRVVAATVGLLAPLQLAQLGRGCAVDVRFADREGLERLGVDDD